MQLTEIFFKSIEFISQNISEKSTKPKFYVQIYKKEIHLISKWAFLNFPMLRTTEHDLPPNVGARPKSGVEIARSCSPNQTWLILVVIVIIMGWPKLIINWPVNVSTNWVCGCRASVPKAVLWDHPHITSTFDEKGSPIVQNFVKIQNLPDI